MLIVLCVLACNQKQNVNRNIALNPTDSKAFSGKYPHAFSNSETRGEKEFLAINAINGQKDNKGHGKEYPSWGPEKLHTNVFWQVDFGGTMTANELVIYLRADFPHDGWWKKATVFFSDNTKKEIQLIKTAEPQRFNLDKKKTSFIRIADLEPAIPDTWCAITEIEVWGY